MELTKRELANRINATSNPASTTSKEAVLVKMEQNKFLQDFVDRASAQVTKLRQDADNANSNFRECAEFFGEDPKSIDCNAFFGYFVRFVTTWKTANEENEKRRKLEEQKRIQQANQDLANQTKASSQANMKNAVINELKSRNQRNFIKPEPNEFQDGTFEDIILGMKSEPYRTNINEGMRKSFRRQRADGLALSTAETEPL